MNGQASMQAIKKSAAVWCILLCKAHTAPFSRHSTYKDLPTHFFLKKTSDNMVKKKSKQVHVIFT